MSMCSKHIIGKCIGYSSILILLISIGIQLWLQYGDQREYNRNTTADEAAIDMDLTDKIIIVTGTNTGIGKPTARVLLSHGAKVIMACRNQQKANKAKEDIINDLTTNKRINFKKYNKKQLSNNLDIILLDLSSLKSIKKFSDTFLSKYNKLNYLILNAGVMGFPQWRSTNDGIEKQFGVNHIGHYYLTKLLTPILIKSASKASISRVVAVSSHAHNLSPKPIEPWLINNNKVQDKNEYGAWSNYGFSKACNILFAKEYNKRYWEKNVYAVSLHPGGIDTELGRNIIIINKAVSNVLYDYVLPFIVKHFLKTTEQGSSTSIRTISITDDEFKKYGGGYFSDCNFAVNKLRYDMLNDTYSQMLWDLSETILTDKIN